MIKLMKHYATDGETKARVHYSRGTLIDGRDCVTLYEKDYQQNLNKVFANAENNSDMMTDYFENNKVRIFPEDSLWVAACNRAN